MSLKIGRNDPCWCGSGKKYKKCHEAFDEKMEIMKQKGYAVIDHDLIKTPEQIAKIKESCKINIAVLDYVEEHIKPGTYRLLYCWNTFVKRIMASFTGQSFLSVLTIAFS